MTGTIVGVNKYKSAFALWAEKTGMVTNKFQGNAATQWGNDLELVVAQTYARDHKKAVVAWPVMMRSKRWNFMLANLDFLIVEPTTEFPVGVVTSTEREPEGIKAILEIKTSGIVGRGSAEAWANDGVPIGYELQGCHYSVVTGIERVVFAALVAGEGLVVRGRKYDEDDVNDLVNEELRFWDYVANRVAPPPDGSEQTRKAIQQIYPSSVATKSYEAGSEEAVVFRQYQDAKRIADEAEAKASALRAQLELAIGDAEVMTYKGKPLFTYKVTSPKPAFDTKKFEAENPELFEKYLAPRSGFRVLRMGKE